MNNERLEYLGDAVLETVVSDLLYHHFDRKREGFLTSTRSKIVSRENLNKVAEQLGIVRLVKTATKHTAHNSYLGGNAFEALMGAVYLDRGFMACKWFVKNRVFGKLLDLNDIAHKEVNFKSKLLEWSQKNRIRIDFTHNDTEGEGTNSPMFYCEVLVEGILIGKGKGFSKKESQQQAAKEGLMKLRRERKVVDSIFTAKEKRTSMEADEFSVLPRIEEIEEAILEEDKKKSEERRPELRTQKPVRKRTRRKAREAAEAAEQQPAAEEQKPSRSRRRRSGKQKDVAADNSNAETPREDIIRQAEEAAFQKAEADN